MQELDRELAKRVRDVVAVATDDIDAIQVSVEDQVAYIEGVVESEEQRRAITGAVGQIDGVTRVITCLATEHVLSRHDENLDNLYVSTPVLMHYYSLS